MTTMKATGDGRPLSLALAVVLVAAAMACGPREEKTASRANTVEIAEDNEALNQLRSAGSNLAKPHRVEFYLFLPSHDIAEAAADEIRPLGYTVTVEAGEDEAHWRCLAIRKMLPTIEEITVARAFFKGIAAKHNGVYGGWDTAIEH